MEQNDKATVEKMIWNVIQIVGSEGFVKIMTKLYRSAILKYNLKSIVTGSLLCTFIFLQKMLIFGFSNSAIDK